MSSEGPDNWHDALRERVLNTTGSALQVLNAMQITASAINARNVASVACVAVGFCPNWLCRRDRACLALQSYIVQSTRLC